MERKNAMTMTEHEAQEFFAHLISNAPDLTPEEIARREQEDREHEERRQNLVEDWQMGREDYA